MIAFAQRIVDEAGEDVTDEWACESNECLQEKTAKRAAKRIARSAARAKPRAGHGNRKELKGGPAASRTSAVRVKKEEMDFVPIVDDGDSMLMADEDFSLESSNSSTTTDGSMGS